MQISQIYWNFHPRNPSCSCSQSETERKISNSKEFCPEIFSGRLESKIDSLPGNPSSGSNEKFCKIQKSKYFCIIILPNECYSWKPSFGYVECSLTILLNSFIRNRFFYLKYENDEKLFLVLTKEEQFL